MALAQRNITFWELSEPLDEENLQARVRQLVSRDNQKASRQPLGWDRFCEYVYKMPKNDDAMRAGTWLFDSFTHLGEHFKSHIMWLVGKSKYSWDQWNAYKIGWMDTVSFLRDLARDVEILLLDTNGDERSHM